MDHAPEPISCPALKRFLDDRRITFRGAAKPLRCSHEHVRKLCLPWDDPKRIEPQPALLARIVHWTKGEITGADFEQPREEAA